MWHLALVERKIAVQLPVQLIGTFMVGALPVIAGAMQGEIKVTYRVEPIMTLHEPVTVTAVLSNTTHTKMQVDLGWNREGSFAMKLAKPDGTTLAVTPHETGVGGFALTGEAAIAPETQTTQLIILNKWFEIDQVGKYELTVSFKGGLRVDDATVAFSVQRRDEHALRQRCDVLLDDIVNGSSTERQLDAAHMLSYVRDPIAVDYLARALDAHAGVDVIMITGLERIATDTAVAVLERARMSPGETGVLAQAALDRLRSRRRI